MGVVDRGDQRFGPMAGRGELEDAEQVQGEEEHHAAEDGDEERFLELEAPAHRVACGPESQHGPGEREERGEDAAGVGQGVRPDRAIVGVDGAGEAVGLESEDREDAGHRVEEHASEEGEQQHPRQSRRPLRTGRLRGGRVRSQPGRELERRAHLHRAPARQGDDAGDARRSRGRVGRGLSPEPEPSVPVGNRQDREDSRQALGDERIGPDEWLGAPVGALHRQLTFEGLAGDEGRGASDRHPEPCRGGWAGNAVRRRVERGRPRGIALPGTDSQHPGELEAGGDALHLADEQLRRGHHGQRCFHVRLSAGAREEDHLAAIPVAGDRAVGAPVHLRRGPAQRAHRDARHIPHDLGGEPGLARIPPVHVPPAGHLQLDAEPERAARLHLGHIRDEGRPHPGLALGERSTGGGRRRRSGGHGERKEPGSKHGWQH
jgi:hypothetical protein